MHSFRNRMIFNSEETTKNHGALQQLTTTITKTLKKLLQYSTLYIKLKFCDVYEKTERFTLLIYYIKYTIVLLSSRIIELFYLCYN